MTKQKRGFWTFVFSLIPGAGEMHMGFMKQGMSIMVVFWLLIGLCVFFNTGVFLFGLPLLWFYSFFNVHNLKGLSEEEFYSITDDYAFHLDAFTKDKKDFIKRYHNIIAGILIFIGITILWNNSYGMISSLFPNYNWLIYQIGNMVPQFVLGFGIILVGISMIRGKKKELEDSENA
jgi:hypothetical protein